MMVKLTENGRFITNSFFRFSPIFNYKLNKDVYF